MFEKVCLAGAVKYDDEPRLREIQVGAVILAPAFEIFNPSHLVTYIYGKSPHILTSLEFERLLSPSGPYKGQVMRPLDRREPRKIAWNTAGLEECYVLLVIRQRAVGPATPGRCHR